MMRRDARDFVDAVGEKAESKKLKTETGAEFHLSQFQLSAFPWLGPVLVDDRGVIQLLHAQKLLPENVRDLVFAPPAEASHAPD
jgi:hypothetical protein